LFREKEHQVKRCRTDRPAVWEVGTYCHSKAVHASFSIVWPIARAQACHSLGERRIKPAAGEIARVLCSSGVAKTLAV